MINIYPHLLYMLNPYLPPTMCQPSIITHMHTTCVHCPTLLLLTFVPSTEFPYDLHAYKPTTLPFYTIHLLILAFFIHNITQPKLHIKPSCCPSSATVQPQIEMSLMPYGTSTSASILSCDPQFHDRRRITPKILKPTPSQTAALSHEV